MFFFQEMLFIYATEPFKFTHSCAHSEHERMCVVITNQCSFAAFKEMFIFRLLTQSFHVTCLSPLNTSIQFTERKTALERVNCNYVRARKFPLKTSLGQMGKQFYTTQLDWNQDFVVLVQILQEHLLPHLLDKNYRGSVGNIGLMHSVENTAIFVIVLAPHMPGVLHMTFSLHFLKNLFTLYSFCRYCQNSRNKQRNQTIKFPWEVYQYCLVLQFLLFNVICLWYLQSIVATQTSSVIK